MDNLEADIQDLNAIFPIGAKKPNWALTGGVAVKYLLESEFVGGRHYSQNLEDEREHKDMDVVVFAPGKTELVLEHPHEIYWKYSADDIERCEYNLPYNQGPAVFCIEFLTHYHFGFPPPHISETVLCQNNGTQVWCVSPEYIVAGRLFHYLPVRAGIDDVDCCRLNKKFKLNPNALEKIVRRSPMNFLSRAQIIELAQTCDGEKIRQLAAAELYSRYPFLKQLDIDPKYLLGYLLLPQGTFTERKFMSALKTADSITEHWKLPSKIGLLNLFYSLDDYDQKFLFDEKFLSGTRLSGRELRWIFENPDAPIFRVSFEYLTRMCALKDEFIRSEQSRLFSAIAKNTAVGFMETDYLHVLVSAIQYLLDLSQELPELQARHFLPLSSIMDRDVTEGAV